MIEETVGTDIDEAPDVGAGALGADGAADARPSAEAALLPIELTEQALEALLFVAERPLSRREIAAMAGTDRETVDARLGDLEVSLRGRGLTLLLDADRVELATAPEVGALVARYVGADAVRLSPASLDAVTKGYASVREGHDKMSALKHSLT